MEIKQPLYCGQCGAPAGAFKQLAKYDPRRTPARMSRKNRILGEAWCNDHLPPQYWPRARKWLYILMTFLRHPRRSWDVLALQRKIRATTKES